MYELENNNLNPEGNTLAKSYSDLKELLAREPINETWGGGSNLDKTEKWDIWQEVDNVVSGIVEQLPKLAIAAVIAVFSPITGALAAIGALFGAFGGGSIFRSTRYWHYYQQTVFEYNANYSPDPINTYAAYASNAGIAIAPYVQSRISTGKGKDLLKYYQYSTRRFKQRNWDWQAYKTADTKPSSLVLDKELLKDLIPYDDIQIIDVNDTFAVENQYYLAHIQNKYGLDIFHKEYMGKKWDIISPPVPNANWFKVAEEDDDSTEEGQEASLLVPTVDVKPSKGLTIWTSSQGAKQTQYWYLGEAEMLKSDLPADLSTLTDGDSVTRIYAYLFINPNDDNQDVKTSSGTEAELESQTESTDINPNKYVVKYKITRLSEREHVEEENSTTKKYKIIKFSIEEIWEVTEYDTEIHYWYLEDGTTNLPGLDKVFNYTPEDSILDDKLDSKTSHIFKYYPIMPIQEWDYDSYKHRLDEYPKENTKLTKAIKHLNDLTKKESEEFETEKRDEDMSDISDRNKAYRNSTRHNQKDSDSTAKSERAEQRFITRELSRKQHYEMNHFKNYPAKVPSLSRLKRHMDYMGQCLGIDYFQQAHTIFSQAWWHGDMYHDGFSLEQIIMPAVMLTSDVEIVAEYWYQWAKRLYKLQGKQDGVKDWYSICQTAKSTNELPMQVISYKNQNNADMGAFAYFFVNKITVAGSVRKIKRKHRVYEIKRGRARSVNLSSLQIKPEPYREVATDSYHVTQSGKEVCIGGGKFAGNGISEGDNPDVGTQLQNYGYTLFCKNHGDGTMTCYGVAGLTFRCRAWERILWCSAWKDLDMQYLRNKAKRVDRNNDYRANVETEHGSRKHRQKNVISYFGIVPLDYHILTKMGGIQLERFAQRSIINYGWVYTEAKGKRSSTAKLIKAVGWIITIVTFVISVMAAPATGGTSLTWNILAQAFVEALITAVVVQIAVKKLVLPLLKLIGLKGLVALIIAIVVIMLAMYFGGGNIADAQNIASETTGKVSQQVGSKAGQEAIKQVNQDVLSSLKSNLNSLIKSTASTTTQSLGQAVVQGVRTAFTQLTSASSLELASQGVKLAGQAYQSIQAEQIVDLQSALENETKNYNEAMSDLSDLQEQLAESSGLFDTKEALKGLTDKLASQDFDTVSMLALDSEGLLAQPDTVLGFIEQHLNIDPWTFDPIKSTSFINIVPTQQG